MKVSRSLPPSPTESSHAGNARNSIPAPEPPQLMGSLETNQKGCWGRGVFLSGFQAEKLLAGCEPEPIQAPELLLLLLLPTLVPALQAHLGLPVLGLSRSLPPALRSCVYNSPLVESISVLRQALPSSATSPCLAYIRGESSGMFSPHLRKETLLFFKMFMIFYEDQEKLK